MEQGRLPWTARAVRGLTALMIAAAVGVALPAPVQAQATKKAPARATATPVAKKATPTPAQRRAAAARARAAVQARELAELRTPRYTVDDAGREVPIVRAAAAIVYNPETNEVLYETNSQDQRSIASITKLMTALVLLEGRPDLRETVVVQRSDVRRASITYLRTGQRVSKNDLLHLLLIGSDNAAARAIARTSPYGAKGFIDRMNEKAVELGLEHTHYADPSGLLADNLSSAYDMARLITHVSTNAEMSAVMQKSHYAFSVGRRTVHVSNTNQLLRTDSYDIVGGKTGFIGRAGYCLATLLRLPQSGQQVAVVVLGSPSSASRFWATRHLFNWMTARADAVFGAALPGADEAENEN